MQPEAAIEHVLGLARQIGLAVLAISKKSLSAVSVSSLF